MKIYSYFSVATSQNRCVEPDLYRDYHCFDAGVLIGSHFLPLDQSAAGLLSSGHRRHHLLRYSQGLQQCLKSPGRAGGILGPSRPGPGEF